MNNWFKNIILLIFVLNIHNINSSNVSDSKVKDSKVTCDNLLKYIPKEIVVIDGKVIDSSNLKGEICQYRNFNPFDGIVYERFKNTSYIQDCIYENYALGFKDKTFKEYTPKELKEIILKCADIDNTGYCFVGLIKRVCEDISIFTTHPDGKYLMEAFEAICDNFTKDNIIDCILLTFTQIRIRGYGYLSLWNFAPKYFFEFFSKIISMQRIFNTISIPISSHPSVSSHLSVKMKLVTQQMLHSVKCFDYKKNNLNGIINALNEGMLPKSSTPEMNSLSRSPFIIIESAFRNDNTCSYEEKLLYYQLLIEYLNRVIYYNPVLSDYKTFTAFIAINTQKDNIASYLQPLTLEEISDRYQEKSSTMSLKDIIIEQLGEKFLNAIGPYDYNNMKSSNLINLAKLKISFNNKLSPFMKNIEYLLPYSHYEFNNDSLFLPGNILSTAITYNNSLAMFLVSNYELYFFPPMKKVRSFKEIMQIFNYNKKSCMPKFLDILYRSCLDAVVKKQFNLLTVMIGRLTNLRKTLLNADEIKEINELISSRNTVEREYINAINELISSRKTVERKYINSIDELIYSRKTLEREDIKEIDKMISLKIIAKDSYIKAIDEMISLKKITKNNDIKKINEKISVLKNDEVKKVDEIIHIIKDRFTPDEKEYVEETEEDIMSNIKNFDDSYVTCINLLDLYESSFI